MINYLLYLIVKLISKFFTILPVNLALWIARTIARFLYIFYPNRKNIAYSNLLSVFGKSKSTSELKHVCKKAFLNLSQTVAEVLRIPCLDDKYLEKYVNVIGKDYIDQALSAKNGVIMLTAHFGNWEFLSLTGAMIGYPSNVLARDQRPKKVNELLNTYRESKGSKVINKGFQTRRVVKTLRENKVVGFLSDQDAGKTGVFVDFLGRPTSTPAGAIAFALKTKAKILPCFIIREKGPYHRVEINSPLELNFKADKAEAIKQGLQKFSNVLSRYVKENPEQWLWFHKRWKSTPPSDLLILDDGKAGHLNQSKAVANIIKKILEEAHPEFDFRIRQVKIEFKNELFRFFTNVCAVTSNKRCAGCLKCLGMLLTKDCYNKLKGMYSDIIISCGSSLEGVNVIMKNQSNAKNIVIMKPAMVNLGKFDLAIISEHDKVKESSNVVIVQTALNVINKDLLEDSIKYIKDLDYNLESQRLKIGILIGGDTRAYKLGQDLIDTVLTKILDLEDDVDLLVTTSRRTSKGIDNLLEERLQNEERCKLLVIANKKNIKGVVPAILGLSHIVVVSGESISMVSEAISSGKRVIAFIPYDEPCYASKKHKIFLEGLNNRRYLTLAYPNNIDSAIKDILNNKDVSNKIKDTKKITKALSKLIL